MESLSEAITKMTKKMERANSASEKTAISKASSLTT